MSIDENKKVVRRIYDNEALHRGLGYLDDLVARDVVNHNPFPGAGPGIEGVKGAVTAMLGLFPDARFSIDDVIAEADKVAVRVTLRGTHLGPFMGRPATGAAVTSSETIIFRVVAGKVVETWASRDDLGMMRQLAGEPVGWHGARLTCRPRADAPTFVGECPLDRSSPASPPRSWPPVTARPRARDPAERPRLPDPPRPAHQPPRTSTWRPPSAAAAPSCAPPTAPGSTSPTRITTWCASSPPLRRRAPRAPRRPPAPPPARRRAPPPSPPRAHRLPQRRRPPGTPQRERVRLRHAPRRARAVERGSPEPASARRAPGGDLRPRQHPRGSLPPATAGTCWVTLRSPGPPARAQGGAGQQPRGGGAHPPPRRRLGARGHPRRDGGGGHPRRGRTRVTGVDWRARKALWTLDVAREPRAVVIHPDGKTAYVSHLTSSDLTRIDDVASPAARASTVPLPAAPAPDARWPPRSRRRSAIRW